MEGPNENYPQSSLKEQLLTTPGTKGYHPAGKVRYGGFHQGLRLLKVGCYFLSCVIMIISTQFVGAPLYFIYKPAYYTWMAWTKKLFGIATTTITQWYSPTAIYITGERDVRSQIRKTPDGRVECDFPSRLVMIANHQLYSDWLYLWWVAYTAKMHGHIYIILKESLKYVPFLGLGMQFYGFIFLARKWEQDKPRFTHRLSKLAAGNAESNPMWLMIFPEGTNLSDNGRNASKKFADKMGWPDMRHQLIPRTTGLRFCLEQLQGSVEWVYDCTVAYEGIEPGTFGQDYFTLYSTYFEGRPPKSVSMYWRRFAVKDIPINDAAAFEKWMLKVWAEKDDLLEHYTTTGAFPEDDSEPIEEKPVEEKPATSPIAGLRQRTKQVAANGVQPHGPIATEVKLVSWVEVLEIYTLFFVALGLYCLYWCISA